MKFYPYYLMLAIAFVGYSCSSDKKEEKETPKNKVSNDGGLTWKAFSPGATVFNVAGPQNDSICFLANTKVFKASVQDLTSGNVSFREQAFPEASNLLNIEFFDFSSFYKIIFRKERTRKIILSDDIISKVSTV